MSYIELNDDALRQSVDAVTVWQEWRRTHSQYQDYVGGMTWKTERGYDYLIKIKSKGKRERVGPRSPETERIYEEFHRRKAQLSTRLDNLAEEVAKHERFNKAVRAGRVPNIVVDILNALDAAGIGQHFVVVGTHALYAYETAAGVRISAGEMTTQDIDLLWDARKKVRFFADMQRINKSVLSILQEVDASFIRQDLATETAINDKGFLVEFLRRFPQDGDPHPFKLSEAEEELWPVRAVRANVLTEAPRFEQPIISVTGRMALMRTISPKVFVEFKQWLAAQETRDPLKRRRDQRQAQTVQSLIDDGLLRV